MNFIDAFRIVDAFHAFREGSRSIPHGVADLDQTIEDVEGIRNYYEGIKRRVGFAEAARISKANFMMSVVEEREALREAA